MAEWSEAESIIHKKNFFGNYVAIILMTKLLSLFVLLIIDTNVHVEKVFYLRKPSIAWFVNEATQATEKKYDLWSLNFHSGKKISFEWLAKISRLKSTSRDTTGRWKISNKVNKTIYIHKKLAQKINGWETASLKAETWKYISFFVCVHFHSPFYDNERDENEKSTNVCRGN